MDQQELIALQAQFKAQPPQMLQHQSIVSKTDYSQKRPDLRRHYVEEWGRFLDNHYDPDAHQKPFCVAMKAPDYKYRYSQGVGLSYKFQNFKVLEKIDVEHQHKKIFEFNRFQEFSQIKDGEVMISIEHCVNCASHQTTTKHDENKYKAFALHLQAAIKEQFPQVIVFTKPISTDQDEKLKHLKIESASTNKNKENPTLIDNQVKVPRIGAFEVQIMMRFEGRLSERILHSKIKSNMWPTVSNILEKVHIFLPKIPQVHIILFRENVGTVEEQNFKDNFRDMAVQLKSTYRSTQSSLQLGKYLEMSENEKLQEKWTQRQLRLSLQGNLVQNRHLRPSSAKTQIGTQRVGQSSNDPYAQVSLFKTSNQYYQKNFQSYTALPKMRPPSSSINQRQNQMNVQLNSFSGSIQQMQQQQSTITNQRQRPMSAFTSITAGSHKSRPFSASSRKNTHLPCDKKGRGLGYFGDSTDKIAAFEERKKQEENYKVRIEPIKANDDGLAIFKNIPVGKYYIEIAGNDLYMPTGKYMTILNEEDNDVVKVYVGIKLRTDQDTEFHFQQIGGEDYEDINFQKVEAKAIYLGSIEGYENEFEEFEFDIVWSHKKAAWVQTLKLGKYLLNVKASGYRELNEVIQIDPNSEGQFKFALKKLNEGASRMSLIVMDLEANAPLRNAFIEFYKEGFQQPDEGVTDVNGHVEFIVKNFGIHNIIVKRQGYVNYHQQIFFTKGLVEMHENQIALQIFMIRMDQDPNIGYIVLNQNGHEALLQVKNAQNDEVKVMKESKERPYYKFNLNEFKDFNLEDSPTRAESKEFNQFLNVSVVFTQKPQILLNEATIDRNFTNFFQDANISINIYYRDQMSQNLVLRTIYPPSFFATQAQIWEVCLVAPPFIFENNRFVLENTNMNKYYSYYKKLFVFFKNRKTQKFNVSLGFDSDGIYRTDDTFLDETIFVRNLDSIVGNKILNHEQLKTIKKIEEGKLSEDEFAKINQSQEEFYMTFVKGFKNIFGYVSYRNFQDYLNRL